MTQKHTPGPWRYEQSTKTIRSVPANYWLATMDSWDGAVNHEANAQFIVTACNAHEELLSACRALYTYAQAEGLHFDPGWGQSVHNRVEAAIAKAEGKE